MKHIFSGFLGLFCLLHPVFANDFSSREETPVTTPAEIHNFEAESRLNSEEAAENADGLEGFLHRSLKDLGSLRKTWKSNSIKPRGLNFRLVRGDGYETKLGLSLTRSVAVNERDQFGVELRYLPHEMKDSYDAQRVHLLDVSAMFRRFLNPRLYAQVQAGIRHYKPNQELKDFYLNSRNQKFESESIPYASIGAGWLLIRDLPVLHRPLVIAASYTFSDSFDYPSTHPLGHVDFDPGGFHVGVKVGFKF